MFIRASVSHKTPFTGMREDSDPDSLVLESSPVSLAPDIVTIGMGQVERG